MEVSHNKCHQEMNHTPLQGGGGWDPPQEPGRVTVESGTDTDTTSDDGSEEIDFTDIAGMTPAEADEHIYWQYSQGTRRNPCAA